MSAIVDQTLKRMTFNERNALKHNQTFVAYCQCPFYDDTKCLISLSVFPDGAGPDDRALIGEGFYVTRRSVVGGIAWDIDVVPRVREKIKKFIAGESGEA